MTFSVLGTDRTGVGMAATSSSPAVAARCIHLRSGVGGAASQNVTDPRLGTTLLDALERGLGPQQALDEIVGSTPHIDYRQLTILRLGADGAAYSGSRSLGTHQAVVGRHVVVAGNMLAAPHVVDEIARSFETAEGPLETRLLSALQAGVVAGGEEGPLRSAGLAVARDVAWYETDLRVDWHDEPVAELARLLDIWLPQREDYLLRALSPDTAPSYGVPGDR